MTPTARKTLICIAVSGLIVGANAFAASHRWVVNEVFSNADGTVQFVELYCPLGAANETNMNGKNVTSQVNGTIHAFTANLPADSTSDKHLLLATQAFADLPGAPTPDHIISANSFSISGDTLQWHIYVASILSFGAGQLPTDGINSIDQAGGTAVNSPTNFNDESGSVDASLGPPVVPDGSAGSNPMTVAKQDATGSTLEVFWDAATCTGGTNHQIIYGEGSDLPNACGQVYTLSGSVCSLGAVSSAVWNNTPSATDGSGMIWWLVVTEDGGEEGPWGPNSCPAERDGTGTGGSSGQCMVADKDTSNACGQ